MEMDSCFAEIPFLVDRIVQFIDVETLGLKFMEYKNLAMTYFL